MAVENAQDARSNAVQIIYASETGTAESVSSEIRSLISTQLPCALRCISTVDFSDLRSLLRDNVVCVFVVATAGDGEVPRSMRALWRNLLRTNLSRDLLLGLRIAILGLGDTSYDKFNAAARRLRARFADLGTSEFVPAVLADDSDPNGPDQAIDQFTDAVALGLGLSGDAMAQIRIAKVAPRARLRILAETDIDGHKHRHRQVPADAWGYDEAVQKDGWVNATVTVNEPLTDGAFLEDDREVRRVVFDTSATTTATGGDDLLRDFRAGDVLELRPRNRASAIDAFLSLTGFSPESYVEAVGHDDTSHLPVVFPARLDALVAAVCDLGGRVRPRLLARLSAYAAIEREHNRLRDLSTPEFADEFAAYAVTDMRTPLMVLRDFPSARPPLDALIDMLPPLRPRAYSISTPLPHTSTGSEHSPAPSPEICAAVARFVTPLRFSRIGIASATLLRSEPGATIPIRVLPGPRPQTGVPAILVAAGAGAAFVRPIAHCGTDSLLFFGCRNKEGDFLYVDEWELLQQEGKLALHSAFSRAGGERIYVQDRIREHAEQVWEWISKKNAHIYISGHAGAYAREVRRAIVDVISVQGHMDEKNAEKMVRKMEKKRSVIFECW